MSSQLEKEQLLEEWIRSHGTAILRVCFVSLWDAKEAEDAMQETFLKAWRAMDSYERRNGAGVRTWLNRIAVNVCRDMKRKAWFRHVDLHQALEELPQGVCSVMDEDRELLLDVMRLPDKYREPVLMYYYQDMTLDETAEALQVSRSTVHSRLRRAEAKLKRELGAEGRDCYV